MTKRVKIKYLIIFFVVLILAIRSVWAVYQFTKADPNEFETTNLDSGLALPETDSGATESVDITGEAELSNPKDQNISGNALITFSIDGFYNNFITAKLPDLSSGYYEAWLVKEKTTPEYLSLGRLTKSDDSYRVNFFTQLDHSDYKKLIVSVQNEDQLIAEKPGKIVLEGKFSN